MDTELARTFLAVISSGNFNSAAVHLHLTQSTVSSRIRSLEEFLGTRLFVRNRAGTTLTAAGRQFQKHATSLVRTVKQARQDVGIPRDFDAAINVGGRFGLWERFLLHWLSEMRAAHPNISVRAEIGFEEDLMAGLIDGRINVGVMYTPQSRPGLQVDLLFEERLALASTDPSAANITGADYVYVDWGPEFYARHSASFGDFASAGVSANIGWLGLQYVLENGGSGYFPRRLIEAYLENNQLFIVEEAPEFTLPAYVVYPVDQRQPGIEAALHSIRLAGRQLDGRPA